MQRDKMCIQKYAGSAEWHPTSGNQIEDCSNIRTKGQLPYKHLQRAEKLKTRQLYVTDFVFLPPQK